MSRIAAFLLLLAFAIPVGTPSIDSRNQTYNLGISINITENEAIKDNITENASYESGYKNNIITWHPQVIEYLYVNNMTNKTVEYSITIYRNMTENRWTVDGQPVNGENEGNRYYYIHKWDDTNSGFHTVNYKSTMGGNQTEFKWYVNVYKIGGKSDGSIFDLIGDMLENHAVELKVRIFKFLLSDNDNPDEFIAQNVKWLHNEISMRQMKREDIGLDFRNGNITFDEYVSAMKQVQTETRYYMKLAQEMANIARSDLNNEELGREFENFSFTDDDLAWSEAGNE